MDLLKVKGIIIKEVAYKDNDKIVTILTDKLGKISCLAKGAKKTNSPILANCQYLVYSEFVLYKSKTFYHINSASVINLFYNFRIDFDKLQIGFELTRILQIVVDENEDTSNILKLFLNTIYALENFDKNSKLVVASFKIKLFSLLGFAPRIDKCSTCFENLNEKIKNKSIYYDYVNNTFICGDCIKNGDRRRYIELYESSVIAIRYVVISPIQKIFSFDLKDVENFNLFGQVFADTMTNGI